LYLLKDERKEAEKLADFQAKADEARFRAAVEFETAIEALREQDLKKYASSAESVGWIPVPGVVPGGDKGQFPSRRRYESRRIVW
jgi:hypothetical protein